MTPAQQELRHRHARSKLDFNNNISTPATSASNKIDNTSQIKNVIKHKQHHAKQRYLKDKTYISIKRTTKNKHPTRRARTFENNNT